MSNEEMKDTIELLTEDITFLAMKHEFSMPSVKKLGEIVEIAREIFFPGYYGSESITKENLSFYLGVNLDKLKLLLLDQVKKGLFYQAEIQNKDCSNCLSEAENIVRQFIKTLPHIKKMLLSDVKAAYLGDPASKNFGEIIYCYPGIKALINYRIAHELLNLNVPLIPRIITEMAHSETGIDIHPGAKIGEYFAIDHGTGIVIGETCIIGNNVKIYQGVTLGAKSFPLDEKGNPIKGIARHPIVEDNVIIYSGATILGRITIGENSVIGGNVWITNDIKANSKILQRK